MPKVGMEDIRKGQVIEAAINAIVSKGLSNLSMKDIAAHAGVSTGIIYHYYESKEDLLMQVLKASFRQSHEKVMETVEPIEPSLEKLLKHLENINLVPKDNPEYMAVFLNYLGEANHNPKIRDMINKLFKNLTNYIGQYLGDVSTDGQPLKNLPIMIIALGFGLGIMWTLNDQLYDINEMDQSLKKLITNYLADKNGGKSE
ncbi:TetR/AcrR family transcriptional regulator [Neobacillus niacini]|uniref:TetR/AcrR family transcriptional regulator n=1 Tax=Neobacillus niacini TaxID=86668 RepID=UPI0021CB9015|nr:TetR/AcrR family transcriptional regulator [Neobacillus niacini]MCM3766061.1 TetR/AcrR family transcriptional regulator [Neobacillus niacini]